MRYISNYGIYFSSNCAALQCVNFTLIVFHPTLYKTVNKVMLMMVVFIIFISLTAKVIIVGALVM